MSFFCDVGNYLKYTKKQYDYIILKKVINLDDEFLKKNVVMPIKDEELTVNKVYNC